MIIEDDKTARESIVDILQMENYEVFSADNGKTGLEILKQINPDLILCDIAMPKMNGYEVYKEIQEDDNLSIIPFIYLTARAEKEDIKFGLRLGVDDYITKPLNFDELLSTISRRLKKRDRIVKETEEKYKTIFENSVTGIFIYSEQSTISYANLKFLDISEYDDYSQIDVINLFDKEEQKEALSKLNSCLLGTTKNVIMNTKIITKTKNVKPVQLYASHTVKDGIDSVIAIIQESDSTNNFDIIKNNNQINKIALIVANKDSVRTMVIKSMLASEIIDIIEMKDELNSIKSLEQDEYDLIISDIDMISTDGTSLVKEIRKIQIYKNTPVITFSTPLNF